MHVNLPHFGGTHTILLSPSSVVSYLFIRHQIERPQQNCTYFFLSHFALCVMATARHPSMRIMCAPCCVVSHNLLQHTTPYFYRASVLTPCDPYTVDAALRNSQLTQHTSLSTQSASAFTWYISVFFVCVICKLLRQGVRRFGLAVHMLRNCAQQKLRKYYRHRE